jgi:hypothetical protein
MSASAVTLTGGSSELILAADEHRDHVTIQLQTAHPVFLAFDEAAIASTGIGLLYPGCSVRVFGAKARQAVYGYAAATPTIGIETMVDVEYRPGSYQGL